jgi:hypothetical protein
MIIFLSICYEASSDAALAIFLCSAFGRYREYDDDDSAMTGSTIATIRRIATSYDNMAAHGDARIYGLLGV